MGKLMLNDICYTGSGGGEGDGNNGVYIEETLWEDPNGLVFYPSNPQTITLSDSIDNYDFLYLDTTTNGSPNYHNQNLIAVNSLYRDGQFNGVVCVTESANNCPSFAVDDDTHLRLVGAASVNPMTAWKVVGIKVSGNYFTPQIYSTEEREVGTWIDGKPLYQVTLTQNEVPALANTGQTRHINLGLSNIENIWVMNASIGGNNTINIPYIHYDTRNLVGYFWDMNNGSPILEIRSGNDSSGFVINCITLQYTKSTDTPGSGSWASNGVPAHHYSTDEQVVGTWIDGSTVYEKIFDLGSDVSYGAGWHKLDIPKGNINRIFDGLFISDTGVSCDIGLACNDTTYLEILVYSGTTQVLGRYIKARYTKGGA